MPNHYWFSSEPFFDYPKVHYGFPSICPLPFVNAYPSPLFQQDEALATPRSHRHYGVTCSIVMSVTHRKRMGFYWSFY
ncbi:hypothetical protein TNCT_179581 [Trichonephila clavata]|uniref:Uncharacterized protein n=1 Tax=Trichonephila clavata TaxID=2740835 RepID=A0A8X6G5J5_TRICU|nr:hypothetical protein TNCT_179581 [Trichonephila clavata]